MDSEEATKVHECEHCGEAFINQSDLVKHILQHGTGEFDQFEEIKHEIIDPLDLNSAQLENGETAIKLEVDELDATSELRKTKEFINTENKSRGKYSCPYCSESYKFQLILDAHIAESHTISKQREVPETKSRGNRKFNCPYCSESFRLKIILNAHVEESHEGNELSNEVLKTKSKVDGKNKSPHYRVIKSFKSNKNVKEDRTKNKSLKCNQCNATFSEKEHLIGHIIVVHTGQNSHKCKDCEQFKSGFLTHFLADHEELDSREVDDSNHQNDITSELRVERFLGCKESGKSEIKQRTVYKEAKKANDTENMQKSGSHNCPYCNQSFARLYDLKEHIRIHTGEKPFTCQHCNKSFAQKSNLVAHIRVHTGEKFMCEYCDKAFLQLSLLRRHMIADHPDEKQHGCRYCDTSFFLNADLSRHIQVNHKEEEGTKKCLVCDVCGKSFSQKSNLDAHIRVHTGERPFKCDHCTKSFSQKDHLVKHIRGHMGEKPYKCENCDKMYSSKQDLNAHIRVHHNVRPYKCEVCQKAFFRNKTLQLHNLVHTGEKPHKCEHCDKTFSQRSSLMRHIALHKGENIYKCQYCNKSFSLKPDLVKHMSDDHSEAENMLDTSLETNQVADSEVTKIVTVVKIGEFGETLKEHVEI